MATSVELRQERARTVEAMREITERAEAENRNLSAEERESYDRGEAEFRDYSERIERQEALERADAENARAIGSPTGVPGAGNSEQRAKDTRAAFLAFARRGSAGITPEQRALVEDATGEILVPEEFETELVRDLPKSAVIRPLANVRSTTSNRKRRRSITETTVGWGKLETDDTDDLTDYESDPTPSQDTWIYVENLYGLAKIGEDELDDTDINLEAFLRDSFGRAISEATDLAFIKGTGHANLQPLGIFATGTGIGATTSKATTYGSTADNAPSVLLDDLKLLPYEVPGAYRRNGVFLLNSTTEAKISVTKDNNGQYLWQPSVQAGRPNTFAGYAVHTQDDIDSIAAAKQIAAFGDLNAGYQILDRQGMQIQRLVELYAENGLIGFKLRFRVGGAPDRPKALHILKTKA